MTIVTIIKASTHKDEMPWLKLRQRLWPSCEEKKHLTEMKTYISSEEKCALLAFHENGSALGFCECTLRHDYVEGSIGSPTAYLEGIFVAEAFRRQGIAKSLIDTAEKWAKQHGCSEMGSDTEISNQKSIDMHNGLGFTEKSRIVHFIKLIK